MSKITFFKPLFALPALFSVFVSIVGCSDSGQEALHVTQPELVKTNIISEIGEANVEFEGYEELILEGWTVMISANVRKDASLYQPAIEQLTQDFHKVKSVVPASVLPVLQETKVWLETSMPIKKLDRLFFNGSRKLTQKHGLDPRSYGGVILGKTKAYLAVAGFKQWQMLHELTHAYHQFHIKHTFEPIDLSFENAQKLNLHNPKFDKKVQGSGYPTRNKKEYFAELTVSYFGERHFYPKNRSELAEYDPQGYCAVVKAWGLLGKQVDNVPLTCGA